MGGAREFLNTNAGKALIGLVLLLCCGGAAWSIHGYLGRSPAAAASADRTFIDAQTGKPFAYTLEKGVSFPVKTPAGTMTGYPAEFCFWTKDGRIRKEPVPVLLNSFRGISGPTFCPDCGRLVVPHNPTPDAGSSPPPTREEYEADHGGAAPPAAAAVPAAAADQTGR